MRRITLFAALALLAVLSVASVADARGGDRNRDRLPDRWERAHHLSLKVNQARRDQDRDGLNNRGEFRAKTNPRDDDSDNDGIEDGQENAGTIDSFVDGVLTITLAQGGVLAASVDGDTEIECHGAAHSSSQGGDDDHGDDDHGDDPADGHGDDHGVDDHSGPGGGEREDGDDRHDGNDDAEDRCGTEALTKGTIVHEAELEATSDGKHWEELELIVS